MVIGTGALGAVILYGSRAGCVAACFSEADRRGRFAANIAKLPELVRKA